MWSFVREKRDAVLLIACYAPHDLSCRHVDRRDSSSPRSLLHVITYHRCSRIFTVVNICRRLVCAKPLVKLLRSGCRMTKPRLSDAPKTVFAKSTKTRNFAISNSALSDLPREHQRAQFSKQYSTRNQVRRSSYFFPFAR